MDFDTLDKQMRSFEQSLDLTMLLGTYIVARLDGHGLPDSQRRNGIWKNHLIQDSVTS